MFRSFFFVPLSFLPLPSKWSEWRDCWGYVPCLSLSPPLSFPSMSSGESGETVEVLSLFLGPKSKSPKLPSLSFSVSSSRAERVERLFRNRPFRIWRYIDRNFLPFPLKFPSRLWSECKYRLLRFCPSVALEVKLKHAKLLSLGRKQRLSVRKYHYLCHFEMLYFRVPHLSSQFYKSSH